MFEHYSVLMHETVKGLAIKPDGTYVDCTLGGGGHAEQIVSNLNSDGLLIGYDQDKDALTAARERLSPYHDRILLIHANFTNLKYQLNKNNIRHVDGILFDLGVSSPQLDRKERGFSYWDNADLDMRMDQTQELSAFEIVNSWSYQQLVSIFFKYGEEKFSKQIARKIEEQRQKKEIKTTNQLVDIIKEGIPAPARRKGGHPAKRIFQALRIAVNDELNVFNDALHQAAEIISIKGRIAVITFHSLEDRLAKQAFKAWSTEKPTPKNLPVLPKDHEAPFKLNTKKPIVPAENELQENRRSRSAKLRIAEKVSDWNEDFSYKEGWNK
ncbi:16S rRNA (cytosine(1402)-N(4))-methyltransferase RsmH [Virgibacillus oceani]